MCADALIAEWLKRSDMTIIKISINDNGEHWEKTVKFCGITVYRRHDFTKDAEKRTVGFNTMAGVSGEIEEVG